MPDNEKALIQAMVDSSYVFIDVFLVQMATRRVGIRRMEFPAVMVHRSLSYHRADRSLHFNHFLFPAQAGVLLLFPRVTQKHF